MTIELANKVLDDPKPKGLARFVIFFLAANADEHGDVNVSRAHLMEQLSMGTGRFSRNLGVLQAEGRIKLLDNGRIHVYDGDQRGVAVVVSAVSRNRSSLGSSSPGQETLLTEKERSDPGGPGGTGTNVFDQKRSPVSEVLDFYDETFGKTTKWGDDDRREVRAALEVASVAELKKAIQGNKLSGFHQGENDRRKKYNSLGHIIRGKRGKKSRRENIEYFIGIFEEHKGAGGSIVNRAADPAVIKSRKEEIRRAYRLSEDEEAQERARRAEVWLEERGIRTTRRDEDGYPIWESAS